MGTCWNSSFSSGFWTWFPFYWYLRWILCYHSPWNPSHFVFALDFSPQHRSKSITNGSYSLRLPWSSFIIDTFSAETVSWAPTAGWGTRSRRLAVRYRKTGWFRYKDRKAKKRGLLSKLPFWDTLHRKGKSFIIWQPRHRFSSQKRCDD